MPFDDVFDNLDDLSVGTLDELSDNSLSTMVSDNTDSLHSDQHVVRPRAELERSPSVRRWVFLVDAGVEFDRVSLEEDSSVRDDEGESGDCGELEHPDTGQSSQDVRYSERSNNFVWPYFALLSFLW